MILFLIIIVLIIVISVVVSVDKSKKENAIKQEEFKQEQMRLLAAKVKRLEIMKIFKTNLENIPEKSFFINIEADKKGYSISEFPDIKLSNITKISPLSNFLNFVVIDIETTGISVGGNKIIEFSAIRFIDFKPIECMTTLIDPKMAIPKEATAINNINDYMVLGKPEFYQIKSSFAEFIGSSPIVGHNIIFDLRHLFKSGLDLTKTKKIYDTYQLSKTKYKDEYSSYSLDNLCEDFKIYRDSGHRSLSDCLATGILFKIIIESVLEDSDINLYEDVM